MNAAVIGIGKMGKTIIRRLVSEDIQVVAAVDVPDSEIIGKDAGTVSGTDALGIEVTGADELEATLKKAKPEIVIEFTIADACIENIKVVSSLGINAVIGTTGLDSTQEDQLRKIISDTNIGAVVSPNMSVGVNVFWDLAAKAAKNLKGYDIEIVEAHHRFKKDAPSGTAMKTANIIAEELGKDPEKDIIYGRVGECPRKPGEIAVHAIRAGDIVGEHTIIFGTLGERVELTHRAHSREAFVEGVIRAVRFIAGRDGYYTMTDVLGAD